MVTIQAYLDKLHPAAIQDDYHVIFVFETCQPDVNGMLQVLIMKEVFFFKVQYLTARECNRKKYIL